MMFRIIIFSIGFLINYSFFELFAQTKPVIPESANKLVNPYAKDKSVLKKGYKIYTKVCWVCHGDAGKGDGPSVPTLTTKPADLNNPDIVALTDGALFWWISNGGNDMQPFKDALSKEEIWMTINYVRRLQKKL